MTRNPTERLLKAVFVIIVLIAGFESSGQSALSGTVKSDEGVPVPFINVYVKSLNVGAVTDEEGRFIIHNLARGTCEITVSGVGYETQVIQCTVPSPPLAIKINYADQELNEIVVEGKSDTRLQLEQPIKSLVVDTKALSRQATSMIDLLNRSAGVRVRMTGGLGSNANISLNGFQGSSIKYFKDGIPMDYLGAGFNFAFVPVNMLERLELYKGVLPVALGADALGGALNMVSKEFYRPYGEVSYEIASFNTHRLSANVFHTDTARHYFIGANAFFNYSDNDYMVTAPVIDAETSTIEQKNVRLFHSQFQQYYADIYGGIIDTPWADELRLSITAFDIGRENPYGARMTQPFGASTSRQSSVIPTLRYKKRFLNEKLSLDQFFVKNTIVVEQTDTVKGTYNWYGEFIPSDSRRGEVSMRGSLSKLKFSIFTSRTYLSYALNDNHILAFNTVHTNLGRVGEDPLGMRFVASGRDILSVPATYRKSASAVGLQSTFMDGRLSNNLSAKHFQSRISATDGDYYGNEIDRSAVHSNWGIAEAIKFQLNPYSFVRLSAESATRLPEQDEIFGDGNFQMSNFELKPERSININAGYRRSRDNGLTLEVNSFYRITHDLILNVPYNIIFNQNQNIENVKGIGFETDLAQNVLSWLRVNANFTYQDFRLFNTNNSTNEGARLRNTPYFFANIGLNARSERLFGSHDRIQGYWFSSFVRQYFLDNIPKAYEPDGFLGLWGEPKFDATNVIPDQQIHSVGVTYFPFRERFSVAGEVKNIFDKAAYDNFKVQNAGRSFHFKLTYTIQ